MEGTRLQCDSRYMLNCLPQFRIRFTKNWKFKKCKLLRMLLWQPVVGQAIIFCSCGYYLSSFFFPRLFSAVADWMSTILPHVMCFSVNLECMSEIFYTRLAANTGHKSDAKNRHLRSVAQLCPAMIIFIHQYQNNCPHNMMNFCLVTAEIDWWILGTPTNFNGFRVLASLLHRCHSTEVNQNLHDIWPFPGLVQYI